MEMLIILTVVISFIKTDQNEFLGYVRLILFLLYLFSVKKVKECLSLPHLYCKCYLFYEAASLNVPNAFLSLSPLQLHVCIHLYHGNNQIII